MNRLLDIERHSMDNVDNVDNVCFVDVLVLAATTTGVVAINTRSESTMAGRKVDRRPTSP